ncbi:MAG TPA: DUF1549 domain-containing protein [Tepidisphaeraceae bacterium]
MCAWVLLGLVPVRAGAAVDFARDVQPILSDNCFSCHGPDANHRKGDLRLDLLDPKVGPFAKREGYEILSPGKLDESVLILRVTAEDADELMPPVKSNRKLTAKQVATLKQWVTEGAKWGNGGGKHWSLEVPTRPALPAVKDVSLSRWVRNPIDQFVVARLEKENLKPSAEAGKETLIRRLTLDLTGLPPTPQEVEAFVSDPSSDAYEKVVDRLLASPRYGEHMAWAWLDVARYADTNGYQNDPTRTMWPWRDWVIRALNENLPYDQFATWQIAGDLLPGATQDQKLASGFNRNHPYNGEGGRIAEETRVENVMDRVDTTSTAFLGLTVGCAKCHDHKFDPISQKEYYQLYAYFNQCSETGDLKYVGEGNVAPVLTVSSAEQRQKLADLKRAAKAAEEKLSAKMPEIDRQQAAWEETARYEKGWIVATPVSVKASSGATMKVLPDSSVLLGGTNPDTDVHEVVLRTDLSRVTGIRVEAIADASLPQGGPGRSPSSGNFVLNQIEAVATSPDGKQTKRLAFASADATYNQESWHVNGAIDADPKTGWGVWKAPDKNNISAVFRLADAVAFPGGCTITVKFHYDSPVRTHTMGRFRLALNDASAATPSVVQALAVAAAERSDEQKKQLRAFYRARINPELKPLNESVAAAKKAVEDFQNSFPKVMVMDDATTRPSKILTKGAYDKPVGGALSAGIPSILTSVIEAKGKAGGAAAGEAPSTRPTTAPGSDRLALAKWMFSPTNPLTARVTVNRLWQQFFAVGIVKTAEDFGVQGERPVHPELLDWLAVQFRDGGWDTKGLVRLFVTSATYRQSSNVTAEAFERDPENRLLARGARFRLASPVLRDQALAAAGLLVDKRYGPPVKPYQPPGIWEEATFGIIKYNQDHGEALYRRSIYTFWRRIVGPTGFFDAPSRTSCTVRPSRTNTPLHALTTLNDITYIEAARGLAQRVLEKHATEDEQLKLAYRLVLSREPREKERAVLLKALTRLKGHYAGHGDEAKKLLAQGESKRDEKLNSIDHAAWTALCLEILNLDETVTKE